MSRDELDAALARLKETLAKQDKDQLIEHVLKFARDDRTLLARLHLACDLTEPREAFIRSIQQAIVDATAFDERHRDENFDYDSVAYRYIKDALTHLVEKGAWEPAMSLTLELMKKGSKQVSASDEGLMALEIIACVKVVLNALPNSTVAPEVQETWREEFTWADQSGILIDEMDDPDDPED